MARVLEEGRKEGRKEVGEKLPRESIYKKFS